MPISAVCSGIRKGWVNHIIMWLRNTRIVCLLCIFGVDVSNPSFPTTTADCRTESANFIGYCQFLSNSICKSSETHYRMCNTYWIVCTWFSHDNSSSLASILAVSGRYREGWFSHIVYVDTISVHPFLVSMWPSQPSPLRPLTAELNVWDPKKTHSHWNEATGAK